MRRNYFELGRRLQVHLRSEVPPFAVNRFGQKHRLEVATPESPRLEIRRLRRGGREAIEVRLQLEGGGSRVPGAEFCWDRTNANFDD